MKRHAPLLAACGLAILGWTVAGYGLHLNRELERQAGRLERQLVVTRIAGELQQDMAAQIQQVTRRRTELAASDDVQLLDGLTADDRQWYAKAVPDGQSCAVLVKVQNDRWVLATFVKPFVRLPFRDDLAELLGQAAVRWQRDAEGARTVLALTGEGGNELDLGKFLACQIPPGAVGLYTNVNLTDPTLGHSQPFPSAVPKG